MVRAWLIIRHTGWSLQIPCTTSLFSSSLTSICKQQSPPSLCNSNIRNAFQIECLIQTFPPLDTLQRYKDKRNIITSSCSAAMTSRATEIFVYVAPGLSLGPANAFGFWLFGDRLMVQTAVELIPALIGQITKRIVERVHDESVGHEINGLVTCVECEVDSS